MHTGQSINELERTEILWLLEVKSDRLLFRRKKAAASDTDRVAGRTNQVKSIP